MLCLTMRENPYEEMIDMKSHLCLHDISAYYDGSIHLSGGEKPGDSYC